MLRAFKYRIYPNSNQRFVLAHHFGCVRYVYNWALAKRIAEYEKSKKTISRFALQAQLPKMKACEETAWLSDVNAQSLQAALRNLDCAYTRFFREKKGFPKFKSKRGPQSFQCPQRCSVDFDTKTISIPKMPLLKYRGKRTFRGEIKTATVSRSPSGKYFTSILVEDGKSEPRPRKRIKEAACIGLDVGLKHFATLSTGEKVENPKYLAAELKRLSRVSRAHSRKKKGSNNRNKSRLRLADIHERVSNQRKDFHHKLSARLIRENQAVAVETLNVSGMQRNRRLARAISDVGWSQFIAMLEYKARWNGKTVLKIGRFEPSSQLCTCGKINRELSLADREWICDTCGEFHDRDILAANNIKRMALHPSNFLAAGSRESTPAESGISRSTKQEWTDEN